MVRLRTISHERQAPANSAAQAALAKGVITMLLEEFNWKKEVLESPDPVLVDFWASWCAPCLKMNPIIESLATDFKVCKVNLDKNQDLAHHYQISSIPAFLIFKGGQMAARHVGVTAEETLRSELDGLSRT